MTDKEIINIRKDFPWFKNNKEWHYLDSSATSLKPKCVLNKQDEYYEVFGCSPHNNDSLFAYQTHGLIKESRELVADLIGRSSEEIVFTSGATESINLISLGLTKFVKSNDEIILTYTEHTSNMLPWFRLSKQSKSKIIWVGKDKIPTEKDILKSVTKKTKIVTFCDVSNILGYYIDCVSLTKKIKKINPNTIVIVDATQSIPHLRHNLKNTDVDFLVFSAHKMLGPTGVGVCFINKKWIEKLDPWKLGGGMNALVKPKTNEFTFASGVDKFEGGTPNTAGIIGFGEAIKYLNKIGWDNIKSHGLELKEYFNKKSSSIKNFEYYTKDSETPILFFNIKGVSSQDLANYLGHNKIIVRAGLSCAKASNISTKINEAVRASLYLYNTKEDIDYLVEVLKKYKKGAELDNVIA